MKLMSYQPHSVPFQKRERDRDRNRETETERQKERDRETGRQRDRDRQTEGEKERNVYRWCGTTADGGSGFSFHDLVISDLCRK